MLWINILHFYQPANADAARIQEAAEKSHLRIIRALEEHPRLRLTANISGCLVERWRELGLGDLIARIARLVRAGRLELTGSAYSHPILPLLPSAEAERQITENEAALRSAFGRDLDLRGFYLPELAYSPAVARLVRRAGYDWLVLDEAAVWPGRPLAAVDRASGLGLIIRSRAVSDAFPPDRILARGADLGGDTLVTATDAELYGLRHIDHTAEFERVLKRRDLETETVSGWLARQTGLPAVKVPAHDWTSTSDDLRTGRAYLLWNDPANPVHRPLWRLARLACRAVEKGARDPNIRWARWHLRRGLGSCTWWWASGHDFRRHFGPLAWDPEAVERGLGDLVRAVRSLSGRNLLAERMAAERLQGEILSQLWRTHWRRYDRRSGVRH